jgi:WD40 repeat protein
LKIHFSVAINQHRVTNAAENKADVMAFETTIKMCTAGTIVIVDEQRCSPTTRAWCLFEWNHTLRVYGFDGLFMTGRMTDERARIITAINVEHAQCYAPDDKVMILGKIIEVHGSAEKFNLSLRLELLLQPLSYKVDVAALKKRCADMQFDFSSVLDWMGSADSRTICIFAGAGQGKSTISAALMSSIFDSKSNIISAVHFLKYSDRRRLDPIQIIKSLAWQLTKFIPSLQKHLLDTSNDCSKIHQITTETDMDNVFEILFGIHLQSFVEAPVYILIDALDEADPIEQQSHQYSGTIKAAGNMCLQLILKHLMKLPPNFKLIITSRPDAVCGQIESIFNMAFPNTLFLKPQNLIREFAEGRVFVYDAAMSALSTSSALETVITPGLQDVYRLYAAIFDDAFANLALKDADCIRSLLSVIMASQEPLSSSLLDRMGFSSYTSMLPGFPTLFFLSDHFINLIHKSLADWLRDPTQSQGHAVDLQRGHLVLGLNLLREVQTISKDSFPSPYCLKYTILHLVEAGPQAADILDAALTNIEFWRFTFRGGFSSISITALGRLVGCGHVSTCQLDCFRWLRQVYGRASKSPDLLEVYSLSVLPSLSPLYWSCVDLAKSPLLVDYKFSLESQDSWPVGSEGELIGHSNTVTCVSFSPCGLFLASGGGGGYRCWGSKDAYDTNLIIWDAASGEILVKLHHPDKVGGVAWTPNGNQIITSCADATVRVWDLCSGLVSAELKGQTFRGKDRVNYISQLLISTDGSSLISGGCDCKAVLWDLNNRKMAKVFAHKGDVVMVAATKDFTILASSCYNGAEIGRMGDDKFSNIFLWKIDDPEYSPKPFLTLSGHENSTIRGLCWSPNARFLVSVATNGINVWDATNNFSEKKILSNQFGPIPAVSSVVGFSPCGKFLAARYGGSGPQIWSTNHDNPEEWAPLARLFGHTNGVAVLSWHPSSNILATGGGSNGISGGGDKTVKLWTAKKAHGIVDWSYEATLGESRAFSSTVNAACLSHDNKILLSGCDPMIAACRIDTDDRVLVSRLDSSEQHKSWKDDDFKVCSLALSRDGIRIANGSFEKMRVFDSTGHPDFFSFFSQKPCAVHTRRWTGGQWAGITWNGILARSVSFSADGEIIAVTGSTTGVRLFKPISVESDTGVHLKGGHNTYVVHTAFHSTDSRLLCSSDFDGKITVWDGISAPDLASATSNSQWWKISAQFNHDPKMDMSGTESTRFCTVWSPDGSLLATSGGRSISIRTVKIFSSEEARTVKIDAGYVIPDAHSDYIMCISFSSDGRTLITGSIDRNVKIFDMQGQGALLNILSGHKGAVLTLSCSFDGSRLVTGGEDAAVLVWAPRQQVEDKRRGLVKPYPVYSTEFVDHCVITSNSVTKSRTKWDLKTGLFNVSLLN